MALLFCEYDGERVKSAAMSEKKLNNESTKVVVGKLAIGNVRCDKCNKILEINDTAYYIANLKDGYHDLRGEEHYFRKNEKRTYTL
mgnify:FL=1